ncbi:hypothetical protein ACUBZR_003416 [Citrobacter braakii]
MKMNLIEMEGFLHGNGIPGDLKVNESNASYLVRKFSELEAKCAALAAENAGLNEKMNKLATWPGIEFYSSAWEFNGGDGDTALEFMCDVQTPSTDAFLAEVRAQHSESICVSLLEKAGEYEARAKEVDCHTTENRYRFAAAMFRGFAAKLRQEAAQ